MSKPKISMYNGAWRCTGCEVTGEREVQEYVMGNWRNYVARSLAMRGNA